jgi:hypothetical protein
MQNLLKEHPVWKAVAGILIFLLITLPLYLGEIWSILEWARIITPLPPGQTLPQWITEQRWPGMTSTIFNWVVLGSVIGMFVFLAAIIRAVRQHRKDYGWLETIADEDDANIEDRMQVFPLEEILHGPPARPHLTGDEPYIELRAFIQNNTVYPLAFDHLEGKFHFNNSPFHVVPQVANKTFTISRLKPYKLKLIQPILKTTAERIQQEGKAIIAGGKITIHCTYKNRAGETKPARIFLEGLRFEITPEQ